MKPRRYLYDQGGNTAALVLLLCLCLTSLFLLMLHGSSLSLEAAEEKKAAAVAPVGVRGQEVMVQVEAEEAPLSPRNARVTFLFIARNRLPLDLVWDVFFRDDKEGRFSIFVHLRPGFMLTRATARSLFFYN